MTNDNLYWSTEFNDGILRGRILFKKGECSHCHKTERLIWIEEVTLPLGLEPSDKFILFHIQDTWPGPKAIPNIGITCGCYGKAMRQIAYVLGRRKERGRHKIEG